MKILFCNPILNQTPQGFINALCLKGMLAKVTFCVIYYIFIWNGIIAMVFEVEQ